MFNRKLMGSPFPEYFENSIFCSDYMNEISPYKNFTGRPHGLNWSVYDMTFYSDEVIEPDVRKGTQRRDVVRLQDRHDNMHTQSPLLILLISYHSEKSVKTTTRRAPRVFWSQTDAFGGSVFTLHYIVWVPHGSLSIIIQSTRFPFPSVYFSAFTAGLSTFCYNFQLF